ncbi:MAG: D-glycerate dehydrogenase [Planctomycetota bacterium]|nr:MAG: D-glycerate dehydrogenase [Planctomycetota bacterium]
MSERSRVFVTRVIPSAGLDRVREAADAEVWLDDLPPPREVLLQKVHGVDGLLSLLTDRVDDELLDSAGPSLRVVSNFAVGYDNIDVPACARRGVAVGNTPGVLTETTADLAFALLMATARRLPEGHDFVRDDRWQTWGPMLLLGKDVHGATLGLVGFGRIGREMARRAVGFGMRTLYFDKVRADAVTETELAATYAPLETVLAESDFVSLHTVLSDETRHLIDAAALAQMRPGAILINTSRGAVVDQVALADALRSNRLFAAGLDVTDPEPLRADHPLVGLPNCLILPHIASASERTRDRMAEKAADNLIAGIRGEPLPDPVIS